MDVLEPRPLSGPYAIDAAPPVDFAAPVQRAQAGRCRFAAGHRSPPQGRGMSAQHEICYLVEGRLLLETALGERIVEAGSTLILSPAEPHSTTALEDSVVFFVLLDPLRTL